MPPSQFSPQHIRSIDDPVAVDSHELFERYRRRALVHSVLLFAAGFCAHWIFATIIEWM
jgi:hypothetical protein